MRSNREGQRFDSVILHKRTFGARSYKIEKEISKLYLYMVLERPDAKQSGRSTVRLRYSPLF